MVFFAVDLRFYAYPRIVLKTQNNIGTVFRKIIPSPRSRTHPCMPFLPCPVQSAALRRDRSLYPVEGLPKLDGLSVLQQWRQAGRHHFDGTWGWHPTGGVVSGAVRSSPFTGVATSARGYPQRKCTTAYWITTGRCSSEQELRWGTWRMP